MNSATKEPELLQEPLVVAWPGLVGSFRVSGVGFRVYNIRGTLLWSLL